MREFVDTWLLNAAVGKLVAAVVAVITVISIMRFLQRSVANRIRDSDVRYRARKGIALVGYVVAVVVVTVVYSDRLGGLTVALGVAGAGIAFALQEVIASVAGWVAVSFAGFYKPGDRVELGGIRGDVIDIGILRTTLMEVGEWVKGDLYSGRIVRIANSFVFKAPVFNYSGDFPFLWDEITVPIKYGSDHRLAREILERVVTEILADYAQSANVAWQEMIAHYLIEQATVEPMVTLVANDNWMEFTVRYVVDYKKRRWAKDRLFTRILDEVESAGGRVALASATFQLVEAPVLDVRLRSSDEKS